jgi:hypothetical protein
MPITASWSRIVLLWLGLAQLRLDLCQFHDKSGNILNLDNTDDSEWLFVIALLRLGSNEGLRGASPKAEV